MALVKVCFSPPTQAELVTLRVVLSETSRATIVTFKVVKSEGENKISIDSDDYGLTQKDSIGFANLGL